MSYPYKINNTVPVKFHFYSMSNFNQDDGFGNCIDTRESCKEDLNKSSFVMDFIYDTFDFVGE